MKRTVCSKRAAAKCEGRIERAAAVMVWTDVGLSESADTLPTAESIAAELNDCRQRLEAILGKPIDLTKPVQLMIFAKTATAQRFLPLGRLSADRPAVYCGPYANVSCISLEGVRGQLSTLRRSIRSLLAYHLAGWPKRRAGFWLGFGLNNYVGRDGDPIAIENARRRVALWAAEGTLMPLGDLLHRRYLSHVSGEKRMLPAVYQQSIRTFDQWLSIIDYLCGPEATPARREQLQNMWRTFGKIQTIERAFTEGCGCSVTEFESQWKAWAATAKFGPPQVPTPEIAAVANEEIIPLMRNSAAPIQRRIRAIRISGRAGWLIGIDCAHRIANQRQR